MSIRGCLSYLFSSNDRKRSIKIDKQIAKHKLIFQKSWDLILLGSPDSGKSTILKQADECNLRFVPKLRWQRRYNIRKYIMDSIVTILTAMPTLSPPVTLSNLESQLMAQWILSNVSRIDSRYFPDFPEFCRRISVLWQDNGVQEAYRRGNEYHLKDNVKYFFDKINEMVENDYVLTDEDILRCSYPSNNVEEVYLEKKGTPFRIIDTGSHNYKNWKVLQYMCHKRTAILFVVDCSSYDVLIEGRNGLKTSFEFLKSVLTHSQFCYNSICIILNKGDLFKEKILSGSKLEDYFPDFKNFKCEKEDVEEHPDVLRAKYFIINEIEKINGECERRPKIYFFCPNYVICAIERKDVQRIINDCCETIIRTENVITLNIRRVFVK